MTPSPRTRAPRHRLRSAAFVLGAVALTTGGVVVGLRHRASPDASPAVVAVPSPASLDARGGEPPPIPVGTTERFTLLVESDITLQPFALAPDARGDASRSAQHIELRTTGVLVRTLLARSAAGTIELLALEGPKATQKALREERRGSVEAALARGVLVERTPEQRVARVRVPRDAEPDGIDALRQLAELTQVARVPEGTSELRAEESAVAGRIAARYEAHAAGDHNETVRRVELVKGAAAAGAPGLETELAGEFHAELRPRTGELLSLRGQQTESKVHAGTRAVFARAATRITVTRADGAGAPRSLPSFDDFGEWIALEGALAPRPDGEARTIAALVQGRTLDDLLRLYRDAAANGDARGELDRTLWAFLKVHPEACKAVAARIAESSLRDGAAQVALSALFRAGHGAAQEGLAEVVQRWRGTADEAPVVAMFGSLPEVTPESESFLRSLRDDGARSPEVASTAGLALASAGGRLRDRAPVRAAALVDEYEQRAKSAESPMALAQSLAALGNVGSERVVELATPHLEDEDPLVRRMAVHALALTRSTEVKDRIARLAETDPDPTVREEAKGALAAFGS